MCVELSQFSKLQPFKCAHHVHTTNSDGLATLASTLEQHYNYDYDIVAVTEHNYLTRHWTTADNVRGGYTTAPLSETRFEQMETGSDRSGRPMLMIPDTNEQSRHHHINTFFVDYQCPSGANDANIRATLQAVQDQNGLSHFNHPGRDEPGAGYTGAVNNASQANNTTQINRYAAFFTDYPTCVGMSIINKLDNESANDRPFWDNVNAVTIPQGKFVWGFANDDGHSNAAIGHAFNVMLMPELSLDAFRWAMRRGSFYAVTRVARKEGVNTHYGINDFALVDRNVPLPVIKDVIVSRRSIRIVAENYSRIDWIAGKTATIAQGDTFTLPGTNIGNFVRANVIGTGGLAFTRPWRIWPTSGFFHATDR
jgi:hypothetical protein